MNIICAIHAQTPDNITYDIKWTRFIYFLQKCDSSVPREISENKFPLPQPGSSGATVKARVTKDDARE